MLQYSGFLSKPNLIYSYVTVCLLSVGGGVPNMDEYITKSSVTGGHQRPSRSSSSKAGLSWI